MDNEMVMPRRIGDGRYTNRKPFFMNYKNNKVYEYQFMGYTFSGGNDADFKMVLLTSSPRWESNNYKRNRGKIYKGYQ